MHEPGQLILFIKCEYVIVFVDSQIN